MLMPLLAPGPQTLREWALEWGVGRHPRALLSCPSPKDRGSSWRRRGVGTGGGPGSEQHTPGTAPTHSSRQRAEDRE